MTAQVVALKLLKRFLRTSREEPNTYFKTYGLCDSFSLVGLWWTNEVIRFKRSFYPQANPLDFHRVRIPIIRKSREYLGFRSER